MTDLTFVKEDGEELSGAMVGLCRPASLLTTSLQESWSRGHICWKEFLKVRNQEATQNLGSRKFLSGL